MRLGCWRRQVQLCNPKRHHLPSTMPFYVQRTNTCPIGCGCSASLQAVERIESRVCPQPFEHLPEDSPEGLLALNSLKTAKFQHGIHQQKVNFINKSPYPVDEYPVGILQFLINLKPIKLCCFFNTFLVSSRKQIDVKRGVVLLSH